MATALVPVGLSMAGPVQASAGSNPVTSTIAKVTGSSPADCTNILCHLLPGIFQPPPTPTPMPVGLAYTCTYTGSNSDSGFTISVDGTCHGNADQTIYIDTEHWGCGGGFQATCSLQGDPWVQNDGSSATTFQNVQESAAAGPFTNQSLWTCQQLLHPLAYYGENDEPPIACQERQ